MTCPECGGALLHHLTYQHRASCRLYAADDATKAHDHENRAGVRPATTTERILIDAQSYPDPTGLLGVRFDAKPHRHERTPVVLDDAGQWVRDLERPRADDNS